METGMTNTFTTNAAIAARGSQTKAIFALQGWLQKKLHQAQHLVNSEPDMQDIIYDELITFANEMFRVRLHWLKSTSSCRNLHELQARYPNHINDQVEPGLAWSIEFGLPPEPSDATMPVWKKPVSASHRGRTQEGEGSRAGLPDFLLYYGRGRMQQSVIFEIKTFWSYRSYHVARMFREALSNNNRGANISSVGLLPHHATIPGIGGGYFDWRLNTIEAVILKQASTKI